MDRRSCNLHLAVGLEDNPLKLQIYSRPTDVSHGETFKSRLTKDDCLIFLNKHIAICCFFQLDALILVTAEEKEHEKLTTEEFDKIVKVMLFQLSLKLSHNSN